MTDGPVLAVSDVVRRWRKRPDPVLQDVSFELAPGDIAWVGGANGAGKTTLLRIICGLLSPDSGEVRVEGLRLADGRAAYYRRLGFLSAGDRGLVARMSVKGHLEYWCRLAYLPTSEMKAAIEQATELLDIEELLTRRVDRLSLGQRQRVRIAMSYLHKPSLLVLDEPRNSLDDAGYESLNRVVQHVAAQNGAVIWCSPRGEDRVISFNRGFQIEAGRLKEIS